MSFGNCGYALPTVMGAKVACPESSGNCLRRRRRLGHEHDGNHDRVCVITFRSLLLSSTTVNGVQRRKTRLTSTTAVSVAGELESESWAEIAQSAMGAEGVTIDKLEDVGPALEERR